MKQPVLIKFLLGTSGQCIIGSYVAGSDLGPEIFEVVTPREKIASHGRTRKIVLFYEEESCGGDHDPKS